MIRSTAISTCLFFAFFSVGAIFFAAPVQAAKPAQIQSYYYPGHFMMWPLPTLVLSEWDTVIRHVSDAAGYDWRFISAMAFVESGFRRGAVSRAGAVGLMQVMPSVARRYKVPVARMADPYINVTLGVRLLGSISNTLHFPDRVPEIERWSIVLAAYNCGLGHVLDARRLAVKYGENHNSWAVVSKYLRLKSEPEYYEDEVVRSGRFTGSGQTVAFVARVLQTYGRFEKKVDL